MKNSPIFLLILIVITCASWGEDRFTGTAAITTNFSFDDQYLEIYGPFHLGLDLNGTWNFFDHFFFWSGIGLLPAWGTIPEIEEHTTSIQLFLQAGIGYKFNMTKSLAVSICFGGSGVFYSESAMETSTSRFAIGFEGGLEFLFKLKKKTFLSLFSDYIFSRDTYKEKEKQPGGLRIGIGIGRYF